MSYTQTEIDTKVRIYRMLTELPHGTGQRGSKTPKQDVLQNLQTLHAECVKADPLFYAAMAKWYWDQRKKPNFLRDQMVVFTANLLAGPEEFRSAGQWFFYMMWPRMAARTLKFMGDVLNKRPRTTKTVLTDKLRALEADADKFGQATLVDFDAIKTLYAHGNVKPSTMAQDVLFKRKRVKGSGKDALSKLSGMKPEEQIAAIKKHKIGFVQAIGSIADPTAEVAAAIIDSMTPNQVVINYGLLETWGATENAATAEVIRQKIEKADGAGVDTIRLQTVAAKTENVQIERKARERMDKAGRLTGWTVVLGDKSGSMAEAIELCKEMAAQLAPQCDKLTMVFFDTTAYMENVSPTATLAEIRQQFAKYKGVGGTHYGVGLQAALRQNKQIDRLIIIGDQEASYDDPFLRTLKEMPVVPPITMINVAKRRSDIEAACKHVKADYVELTWTGDPTTIPTFVAAASRRGTFVDVVLDIAETQIPVYRRKSAAPVAQPVEG